MDIRKIDPSLLETLINTLKNTRLIDSYVDLPLVEKIRLDLLWEMVRPDYIRIMYEYFVKRTPAAELAAVWDRNITTIHKNLDCGMRSFLRIEKLISNWFPGES